MHEDRNAGTRQFSKHHPKGLTILHEDRDIIVIDKPAGLLTMATEREREKTAYFMLTDYVRKGNPKSNNRIFIVHRLDRETSGIVVFAKTEQAKRFLQDNWHDFSKKYVAVVRGSLKEKDGIIESYLAENQVYRVYSVSNPAKGKFSKTGYRVLRENQKFSLLEIDLFTGTKNQIRVHFSEMGHPVAGDQTYGTAEKGLKRMALHSMQISFVHPFSKAEISLKAEIPSCFFELVR
jgi:tRNA pseudouridine32 synthase/23S rRNA pseudouridine746 synthase/23S rRNA pseudouridine1911/1915/1917 synthase